MSIKLLLEILCFIRILSTFSPLEERSIDNIFLTSAPFSPMLRKEEERGCAYRSLVRGRGIISSCAGICRAKIIPFSPAKRIFTDDTLVVGDAAGFVRPATGEGIFFAMLSGRIAAQTIIEQHAFSWYEQRCRESFGRFLKPTRFRWSRSLLRRTLETAVHIGSRDKDFARLLVENFFRVQDHRLGGQFIRRLFR